MIKWNEGDGTKNAKSCVYCGEKTLNSFALETPQGIIPDLYYCNDFCVFKHMETLREALCKEEKISCNVCKTGKLLIKLAGSCSNGCHDLIWK